MASPDDHQVRGGMSKGVSSKIGTADIDHVVVAMLENRSFDNLVGWTPARPSSSTVVRCCPKRWPIERPDAKAGLGQNQPNQRACE